MGRLVLHRLAATVPVLLLVTAGVFALLHLTPGDPIDAMMAESVDTEAKASLRRELGLDRPLHEQYAAWMGRLLRGDLGRSIRNGEPVIENVSRRIRPSLELALLAMAVSLLIAFPVGIVSAARRNTAVDRAGTSFALFGICMPNFLLALLLIFLFGVTLRWLPISGYTDPVEEPLNGLRSPLLPAVTLGLALAAVITEYVFALPGVGRLVVEAVFARDYPLVQGVILLIALGFILSNLLVDLLYGWIDPRIRYR